MTSVTLNQRQSQAVRHPPGPVLLLGGPGTGKSTVMLLRIVQVLVDGARAEQVIFITPHDHAARTMEYHLKHAEEVIRLCSLTPSIDIDRYQEQKVARLASSVRVSTPEQLACRILRSASTQYSRCSLWGHREALRVIRSLWKEAGGPQKYQNPDVEAFYEWHAANRRRLYWVTALPAEELFWLKLESLYEARKGISRARDMHDLVPDATELLSKAPEAATAFVGMRPLHILVDHFQDLTDPEYRLISELAGSLSFITIASDPAQRIRGGAPPDLLNRFSLDHPRAAVFEFPFTYRTSATLSETIKALTDFGTETAQRNPFAYRYAGIKREGQVPAVHVTGPRPEEEVRCLSRLIDQGIEKDGHRPDDIVIVYTKGTPRVEWLATQLASRGIPFHVQDELLRKDRKGRGGPQTQGTPSSVRDSEVGAVLAMLRSIFNPYDLATFEHAVSAWSHPGSRHPSSKDFTRVMNISNARGVDLVAASRHFVQDMNPRRGTFRVLSRFIENHMILAREMEEQGRRGLGEITELARALLDRAKSAWVQPRPLDPELDRLMQWSREFPHHSGTSLWQVLGEFLDGLSPELHPNDDRLPGPGTSTEEGGITITTVERTIDREWDWVLAIVDWDPGRRDRKSAENLGLTSSRRCFLYCAASRAKRRLDLIVSPFETGGTNVAAAELVRSIVGD